MVQEIIKAIIVGGGLSAAFAFLWIGYCILRADRSAYHRNRVRTCTTGAALRGDVRTFYDGTRDYQIAAGVAIHNGRWIEQGKLSNEAVANVLR